MIVEVTLLDGNAVKFDLEGKATGDDLLNKVAEQVQLVEKDYFGFLHVDQRDKTLTWLHMDKGLSKQLKDDRKCIFQVKFYPPEPAQVSTFVLNYFDLLRKFYSLCITASRRSDALSNVPANSK